MSGTFELFHLSLIERKQGRLFAENMTREKWIKTAFSRNFVFIHRSKEYHWVPLETETDFVLGNVAKTHKRVHHTPPEEGAIEVISDEWQGALLVIDPAHHEDGQKLSFERDYTIGQPRAVLPSLLAIINEMDDAPYAIEPKPIFDEASFWGWAMAHENRVRRISFDFVAPNMWDSSSELDQDLLNLRQIGVQKTKVSMDGPDGIDTTSQPVKDGVDYASKGGGSITAKAINGDKFSSTRQVKTSKLPTTSVGPTKGIKAITKWFPRLLGREQNDSLDSADSDDGGSVGN